MLDILNSVALTLMTSVGHLTGLFDSMREVAPSTSEEIANVSGLNERYAREWLGAMVTGKIMECDPEGPRFYLPAAGTTKRSRKWGTAACAGIAQPAAFLNARSANLYEWQSTRRPTLGFRRASADAIFDDTSQHQGGNHVLLSMRTNRQRHRLHSAGCLRQIT